MLRRLRNGPRAAALALRQAAHDIRHANRRNPLASSRGRALILAAAVWIGIGLGVTKGLDPHGVGYFHLLIPAAVRSGLWLTTAGIALIGACFVNDRWFFAALVIMPMIRLSSAAWSLTMAILPDPPGGDPDAWYRGYWYVLLLAFVWYATSSVQDEPAPLGGKAAGDGP